MPEASLTPLRRPFGRDFILLMAALACAILALFYHSFEPNLVLFSNDAPLGLVGAQSGKDASTTSGLFSGYWQDLNWLGIEQPSILPSMSFIMYDLLFRNPVTNAKFYAPVALIFLGFSAWLFFRQLGFRNSVCVLGGLAAALNMNTFSNACWGLPSRALTQSAMFLALAALQSATRRNFWIKAVLAGMAVGFGVMEGFDVGALYSVVIAAFAFFAVVASAEKRGRQSIGKGVAFVAVIALCAGWLAAHALSTLIGTQIKGVAGMQQDQASKEKRWTEATQWSLPKIETARVVVPGLFGYRMDPGPSRYWGAVGQAPGVPSTRHSGSGEYAGILIVLVASWGIASAFRKQGGSLTLLEKRYVKFWAAAALVALLFAWGRHAPFYRIIYSLPYFSTIRNPIKFMHIFHLCLLILFAFGLEEIFRGRIAQANGKHLGLRDQLRAWWKGLGGIEKKWSMGTIGFGVASVLITLIYISSGRELTEYLKTAGFAAEEIPTLIKSSVNELWLYIFFYAISLLVVVISLSGWFAGTRWKVAVGLFAAIIFIDLARANQPWIQYYDYKNRYSSNPVFDLLKQNAYEQRTTFKLSPFVGDPRHILVNVQQVNWWPEIYSIWLQNQFPYHNIMTLEPIQMPRPPEMDLNFIQNFFPRSTNDSFVLTRMLELTSTRYMLGQSGYTELLLNQLDGGRNRFRPILMYNIVPKGNASNAQAFTIDEVTTQIATNGTFNIVEFTAALPRVKLFTNWQIATNDQVVLQTLRDPGFDPSQTVLVSPDGEQIGAPPGKTNATATAKFGDYHPKAFDVQTQGSAPGILLVNDKFSPNWRVWVDGQPKALLRCNYIMRGVYLPEGSHKVEFKYRPPINSLYVTLSAMAVGFVLLLFVGVSARKMPKTT